MTTALIALGFVTAAPPQPVPPPAPLVYVRVVAPAGSMATVHPATPAARTLPTPATLGLRPGYRYRLALSNFANEPGVELYPEIDVIGALYVPLDVRAQDFPAPVTVTEDDVRRVLAGGVVTKVVYLENPVLAAPVATTLDQPLEIDAVRHQDPLAEARKRGRPLYVFRMGGRVVPPGELAAIDVPNTVLLPGEPHLASPPTLPTLPAACFLPFDPVAGPKLPVEEMLADGGDTGLPAGTDATGRIGNLDPTDTAVQYRYGKGKRVSTSNRVCLFAPRFVAVRQERSPAQADTADRVFAVAVPVEQVVLQDRLPPLLYRAPTALASTIVRESLRGTESRSGTASADQYLVATATATVEGVQVKSTSVEPETAIQLRNLCKPDAPLVIVKAATPKAAQVGDVVTFKLTFENYGVRPMSELVIEDSLSPRFEFVDGSAQADRAMAFTVQPNEAGSLLLRWQVPGVLPPGQIGVITFQARVR